jgi:hypothetical protein
MKKWAAVVVCLAALECAAFASDSTASFKKFLVATEKKVAQAIQQKNVAYFEGITTPDYKDKSPHGTTTKAQTVAQMKQMFATCQSIKATIKIVATKVTGTTGTASVAGHIVFVSSKLFGDNKAHTFTIDEVENETWVRTGSTWKLKLTVENDSGNMTVDGKPIKHQ